MSRSEQKVVQYLNEAHATEHGARARAAVADRDDARAAATARRSRRTCGETRDHAERVAGAPRRARPGRQPAAGRSAASPRTSSARRSRSPRRRSISCAAPAARRRCSRTPRTPAPPRRWRSRRTPRSSASRARSATSRPRSSPRRSAPTRRRCSSAILREIPKLTDAVVRADVEGDPSYDVTKTGAADAARATGQAAAKTARKTGAKAKRSARRRARCPGVAQAEGPVKGAVASAGDLAIARLRHADRRGDRRAGSPSSRRSTSPRSTSTSASTRTARRCSTAIEHAARRRAVAGLRRADGRRGPDGAGRGRRRPRQAGPDLRARPQGPRRRARAAERELTNA